MIRVVVILILISSMAFVASSHSRELDPLPEPRIPELTFLNESQFQPQLNGEWANAVRFMFYSRGYEAPTSLRAFIGSDIANLVDAGSQYVGRRCHWADFARAITCAEGDHVALLFSLDLMEIRGPQSLQTFVHELIHAAQYEDGCNQFYWRWQRIYEGEAYLFSRWAYYLMHFGYDEAIRLQDEHDLAALRGYSYEPYARFLLTESPVLRPSPFIFRDFFTQLCIEKDQFLAFQQIFGWSVAESSTEYRYWREELLDS